MSCIWDYLGLSRVLCWFMLIWPVTCLSEFSISLPPAWFHGSDDALELMLLPTPKPDLPVQKIRVSFFSSQVGWISFFPSSARTRRNFNIQYIYNYIYILYSKTHSDLRQEQDEAAACICGRAWMLNEMRWPIGWGGVPVPDSGFSPSGRCDKQQRRPKREIDGNRLLIHHDT